MADIDCDGIAPYESVTVRKGRNRLIDRIKNTVLRFDPDITYLHGAEAYGRYDLEFSAGDHLKTRALDSYVFRQTGVVVNSSFQRGGGSDDIKLVVTVDKDAMFNRCCTRYSPCQVLQLLVCAFLLTGMGVLYWHYRR